MKKKINWKLIFNIATMLVPIGLIIYFLVSEQGLLDLIEDASRLNGWWIFGGVCFHLLNIFIDSIVLYIIAHSYDNRYKFKYSLKATAIGQFFTVVTPAAVGAQPMQAYCMTKQNMDGGVASSCLLQKFLIYQTTITVYSFVAMLFNLNLFYGDLKNLMLNLAIFGFLSHVIIVAFMYIISFNKKLAASIINLFFRILAKTKVIKKPEETIKKLDKQMDFFHESNSKLYKNKKLLVISFLLTAIQLTFLFSIPYAIYKAFYLSGANASDMITAQAFVTMVSSFMPLPGGSGAAEGSFYVFFKIFFTENIIKSAIIIWRGITYFLTILLFAPFSNVSKISKKSEETKEEV